MYNKTKAFRLFGFLLQIYCCKCRFALPQGKSCIFNICTFCLFQDFVLFQSVFYRNNSVQWNAARLSYNTYITIQIHYLVALLSKSNMFETLIPCFQANNVTLQCRFNARRNMKSEIRVWSDTGCNILVALLNLLMCEVMLAMN